MRLELEENAFLFSLDVYLFLLVGMFYKIKYNHVYVDIYAVNNMFVYLLRNFSEFPCDFHQPDCRGRIAKYHSIGVLALLIVELCLILCSFYGFSLSIYGIKRHLAANRYWTHKGLIWPNL